MTIYHPARILIPTLAAALTVFGCSNPGNPSGDAATASQPPIAARSSAAPQAMKSPATVPLSVVSIDLGSDINADNKVTHAATTFAPGDTIYASVNTAGSASSATLKAHWTYQTGKTVGANSTDITPTGPASTAFHLANPDGLASGSYKLEISLNGKPAASTGFSVR